MSKGLGRVQEAVLADLIRRRDAGERPLNTRHVEGFTRPAVSRAYLALAERGHIAVYWPEMCRQGNGCLVRVLAA